MPTVDGVLTPTENTIAVHSGPKGNYILALTHFDLPSGTALTDFIDTHSQCFEVNSASGDPYQLPGRSPGRLFADTRCGPHNTSYLYFIQEGKGYRFTIEAANRYAEVAPHIQTILASFRSFAPTSEPTPPLLGRQPSLLDTLPVIGPENAAQLAPVARLGKGRIADFALSPTANLLAAATPSGVYLYQIDTLAEEYFIPTGNPALTSAFSPDGTLLATALADYSVRVWDAATGNLQHTLTGPVERIHRLAFSPDGRQLAAVSGDGILRGWEITTGRQRYQIGVHPHAHLAFSPDGRWLATGGGKLNRQVQVLEINSGQIVAALEISPDLLGLAFSPNSQTVALSPSGDRSVSILLWDFLSGQTDHLQAGDSPHSLAWHPAGALLATGGLDGNVTVWDVVTGDVRRILGQHDSYITALIFSPKGQYLASSDGATLKIWETDGGTLKYVSHQFTATQPVFSADDRYLAFMRGGTVGLVDLTTGQQRFLPGHSDAMVSLAFSPNGNWLVIGDYSGLVQVWQLSTGQPVQVLDEHTGPVGSLAFSSKYPGK